MTDRAWPLDLPPQLMTWGIVKAGVTSRSPYAGNVEAVTFPGWYWHISVTLKPRRSKDLSAGNAEAFFEGLVGADNAVMVFHWLRPVPRGTLRGTPVVAANTARGAQTIPISGNGSLLAGDLFKVGGVVYKCLASVFPVNTVQAEAYAADYAANYTGGTISTMLVPLVSRVRNALTVGQPVEWDRPTVRCIMTSMSHDSAYQPGSMIGSSVDLEEA